MRRFIGLLVVIYALLLAFGLPRRTLIREVSEQESHEIAVALARHGIHADVEPETAARKSADASFAVHIWGGDYTLVESWRVLHGSGLPRSRDTGLHEVFAEKSMIPTAGEEKARLLVGLSGELSRTLKTMPGVVDARVHLVLPETNPLLDKPPAPSASVLLKSQQSLAPKVLDDAKGIVAGAVQGLTREQVQVYVAQMPGAGAEPALTLPPFAFLLDCFFLLCWVAGVPIVIVILYSILEGSLPTNVTQYVRANLMN
jgi:type III secretion protein J